MNQELQQKINSWKARADRYMETAEAARSDGYIKQADSYNGMAAGVLFCSYQLERLVADRAEKQSCPNTDRGRACKYGRHQTDTPCDDCPFYGKRDQESEEGKLTVWRCVVCCGTGRLDTVGGESLRCRPCNGTGRQKGKEQA